MALDLEQRRKDMQRAIQKKTAELRAAGVDAAGIKAAVNRLKREEQKKVEALLKRQEKFEKGAKHDLVIIPILWRRHEKEATALEEVAEKIKHKFMSLGIDTWVDGRRQYTPGQKFAYWEHLGIKFRIEIGPEDFINQQCKIVYSETPGAYLEHQRKTTKLTLQHIAQGLQALSAPFKIDPHTLPDDLLFSPQDQQALFVLPENEEIEGNFAIEAKQTPNPTEKERVFGKKRRGKLLNNKPY